MQPLRVLNASEPSPEIFDALPDWDALQADLARQNNQSGKTYWRSLSDLVRRAGFAGAGDGEETQLALLAPLLQRRDFLRLLGASLALGGLASGCTIRQPDEKILPYADQPDGMVLGRPLLFATAFIRPEDGTAIGVLARSREGRPVKIEGNPAHPASRGKTEITAQASLLTLYDPDRSQAVQKQGEPSTWSEFLVALSGVLPQHEANGGAGICFLSRPTTSPTLAAQWADLQKRFPAARWITYAPADPQQNAANGARLAFGQAVQPVYHFDKARCIVSFDSDFLHSAAGSVRYAGDFASGRRANAPAPNRLYVFEPTPSITGASADHRWAVSGGQIEAVVRAIAQALKAAGQENADAAVAALPPGLSQSDLDALIADLKNAGASGLALAGTAQPPVVHALCHAINHATGGAGKTVSYIAAPAPLTQAPETDDLSALVRDMRAGDVRLLVLCGNANPLYDAPVDLNFAQALQNVPLRIHHGLYQDETAPFCHWHIPEAQYLETWSDASAFDGTVSVCQPLIAPLYGGKSVHELLAAFTDGVETTSHDIVKNYWRNRWESERGARGWEADFDVFWRATVQNGIIASTAAPVVAPTLQALPPLADAPAAPLDQNALEIVFRPDPTVGDGYWANNGWLQELPKPLTRLVWDNAVLLSPRAAQTRGLKRGDVVTLSYKARTVRGPVWTLPGQADDCATVWLGAGRTRAGSVGSDVGFDAYALRTGDAPHFGAGLTLVKTGETYPLACVEAQQTMEGRDFVRTTTRAEYEKAPDWVHHFEDDGFIDNKPSMVPDIAYEGHKWGMTIDLNTCIGCNACAIACQAENNIPVVGKEEVGRGRQMHWIRVDRYYEGSDADVPNETVFQPVTCMHCERAPCELVCPVEATVHDDEGINNMVYNRCVGTRYCSNNCPYKVRRFNFLDYSDRTPLSLLRYNPEVTVRTRGVMEKCSFCIQRIKNAEIDAQRENRAIADGEVVTACQQVCPTDAILFGDLNDPKARVTLAKQEPRNYGLLTNLNTVPRTTYLGRIRNPNPDMKAGA